MMKSLYLFVDSERTDQYLNSVVYCIQQKDVRRVIFLHIRGFSGSTGELSNQQGVSHRVMGAVQALLASLAQRAEYVFSSGKRSGEKISLVNEYGKAKAERIADYYKSCRNRQLQFLNEEIEYAELGAHLRKISREGDNALVDVTSIKKRYLGDIIVASLIVGMRGLYTLDALGRPDFDKPWRMLLHEEEEQSSFEHVNLLDTELYRACLRSVAIRAPRLVFAAVASVILVPGVVLLYFVAGPDSAAVQGLFAASGVASILSLAFLFAPPR